MTTILPHAAVGTPIMSSFARAPEETRLLATVFATASRSTLLQSRFSTILTSVGTIVVVVVNDVLVLVWLVVVLEALVVVDETVVPLK